MSDETMVAPEVEIPAPAAPAPKKEHWKVKAKREREEAARAALERGESAEAIAAAADAPVAAPGFLSWDDFCNRVAVDLVTSQFGFQMLTNYTGPEAAQVFHSRMTLAYKAMADAHARGPK